MSAYGKAKDEVRALLQGHMEGGSSGPTLDICSLGVGLGAGCLKFSM